MTVVNNTLILQQSVSLFVAMVENKLMKHAMTGIKTTIKDVLLIVQASLMAGIVQVEHLVLLHHVILNVVTELSYQTTTKTVTMELQQIIMDVTLIASASFRAIHA